MPALKPWYRVVSPREDLRQGKPLDASEFAVHLDQVRDGRTPTDYQKSERFFDPTYLRAARVPGPDSKTAIASWRPRLSRHDPAPRRSLTCRPGRPR
jgi:hypothetical protein